MQSAKRQVNQLVQLMLSKGINHVVISPGSRNAPLIISFENEPKMTCLSVPDERAAGFFAMGMAQVLGKPVAVVCTSGSAAINYAPAVVEAFYQKIPLVVLTADRPTAWVDQGDGQTIRQKNLFGRHILAEFEPTDEPENDTEIWANERGINETLNVATFPVKGPVHLNMPFKESLYVLKDDAHMPKLIETVPVVQVLPGKTATALAQKLSENKKILVVCGLLPKSGRLNKALSALAEFPQVVVLTENTSNLYDDKFIACKDRLLVTFGEGDAEAFQPDILLTIGGMIVSKKLKQLLRDNKPKAHWHISPTDLHLDTFQSLTQNIPLDPAVFLEQLYPKITAAESNYGALWLRRNTINKENTVHYAQEADWSDWKVFDTLLPMIPSGSLLHMGNSSSVRYAQLFDNRPDLAYFANRGASGIDGCTSTAAGAAWAFGGKTTLVSGDMAFLYDTHGLWHDHLHKDFKIIMINNQGGNIFRIIDGPTDTPAMEEFFEAHHERDATHIAAQYGLHYFSCFEASDLKGKIEALYATEGCALLEIHTPRLQNDPVLKSYFKFLKQSWMQQKVAEEKTSE